MDPHDLVRRGYDAVAERYLSWSQTSGSPRALYLEKLLVRLPSGATVLELGCGAGLPLTRALTKGNVLVALDFSREQLNLARRHAPKAIAVQGDMRFFHARPKSLDAVVAFYALTHVAREEHEGLLRRAAGWLRPGGVLVATMGAGDDPGSVQDDWLGAPMFFSHFDAPTNRDLVRSAGFELEESEVVEEVEDGTRVRFLWVVARRVGSP